MKRSLGPGTYLYPTPALIVGSHDANGRVNMMTAAWGGVACSKPPAVNISLRKATYTYGNIVDRKAFTVNIPSEEMVRAVDYFGIASGRDEDKVKKAGLTWIASDKVDAPYLKECPLILECRLLDSLELGLHTLFVGEVIDTKADEHILDDKNIPMMKELRPLVYAQGERVYYGLGNVVAAAFSVGKQGA